MLISEIAPIYDKTVRISIHYSSPNSVSILSTGPVFLDSLLLQSHMIAM